MSEKTKCEVCGKETDGVVICSISCRAKYHENDSVKCTVCKRVVNRKEVYFNQTCSQECHEKSIEKEKPKVDDETLQAIGAIMGPPTPDNRLIADILQADYERLVSEWLYGLGYRQGNAWFTPIGMKTPLKMGFGVLWSTHQECFVVGCTGEDGYYTACPVYNPRTGELGKLAPEAPFKIEDIFNHKPEKED
jgi:hypothetical protein